jgi:hypothetical protein
MTDLDLDGCAAITGGSLPIYSDDLFVPFGCGIIPIPGCPGSR